MPPYSLTPTGPLKLDTAGIDSPLFPEMYSLGGNAGDAGLKAPSSALLPQWGAPAAASGSWWDSFKTNTKDAFGTSQNPGWATAAFGAGQGLLNGWLGMQQYGLAKDKLAEGKRQFELNYNAQRSMTNADLEDRQRARVASNANAYESVGSYMDKHGVKGLA